MLACKKHGESYTDICVEYVHEVDLQDLRVCVLFDCKSVAELWFVFVTNDGESRARSLSICFFVLAYFSVFGFVSCMVTKTN